MKDNIINNMNDINKKVEEVALYIRVSTEEQAINGDSLRMQREELTKYALDNNFHIMGIYEDDGFSATNLRRPALQSLLKDVRHKKINRILITKLDRLSRGVRNYYKILDTLDEYDVFWQTIFEKYDSSTANGRLHINIMLSVAENEAAQTSERIRSVFKNKLFEKEIISGSIPIGYKKQNKRLVIDESKKQFVVDTFEYFLKSGSVYKTFDYLTSDEMKMNYMRTYRMLTNKLYVGIKPTKYGDIEGYCEPIISQELFNKVQAVLKKNERKRTAKSGGFIFTSMLKCPECGGNLSGKFEKGNPPTCTYYYMCNRAHLRKTCTNLKYLNEYKIEQNLLKIIAPEVQKYIDFCKPQKTVVNKIDNSKEINSINRQLEKLRDLYVRDLIQLDHYEKQYKELIDKLTVLSKQESIKEEKSVDMDNLKSFLSDDFVLLYNKLDRQQKRRIWLSVIDYIEIDENYKMKVFFI